MNLIYGEIIEVSREGGMPVGKVRVHGAIKKIPLGLLTDTALGDRVLICDGVAISKVARQSETEKKHVSGNSRKAH
jgi:hydrogenase maturation factor